MQKPPPPDRLHDIAVSYRQYYRTGYVEGVAWAVQRLREASGAKPDKPAPGERSITTDLIRRVGLSAVSAEWALRGMVVRT